MNSWYALLVVSIVFMAGVIAGLLYMVYEHNELLRKVQKMQGQLETIDHFVDQMLDYQVRDGCRLNALEELTGAGHSETQSDDVPMGGR